MRPVESCKPVGEQSLIVPVVGISLLTLVPGVVGGSETYVRALTRTLARVGELKYLVYVPTLAPDAGGGLPSHVVAAYPASMTTVGRMRAMATAALLPRRIKRELKLEQLGAIHFPLTVMLPPVDRPPAVTTILDVAHECLPSMFSPAERAYRRVLYSRTARRSRLVVAISEHVRQTLIDHLPLLPEQIRVIPLGVDHSRFRPAPIRREPFVFYPANGWPHKNHERLIAAFSLVRRERPELTLLLTGRRLERFAGVSGVDVRGHVDDTELVRLYQTASALVFPSLYEGFGLPILEAMACGCPVAASDAGALREVCGDAALLFDPHDDEAIASGILAALRETERLSIAGLEHVAQFTWHRTARAHEAVYRELLMNDGKPTRLAAQ